MPGAAALRYAQPRVPAGELGSPGTRFFAGYLGSDEYVPELRGRRALDTYDRMRRSDPTVKALLQAIKLPLLGATWDVEPARADPSDAAVAAFVRWNLFAGMSMTWEEHLRHLLTHLDFGFYVSEIVWDVRDDLAQAISLSPIEGSSAPTPVFERPMAVVRKLAPRLQRTIERWWLARDGGLERVTQRVYDADQNGAVDIPVERLLVFSNEKEGADFQGRSVLRPAYKPWFIKDQLERIFAIAAERHGVGIPVMEVDAQSYNDDNVRDAEEILSSVRAHEKGYIVEIPGVKFRLEGMGQGRALDVEPAIGRLSREILVGGLAQFIALGGGPAGSFALSEDQTSMFMRNERALAAYVAGVHDRYLIPKLVDLNFAGVRRYPRLVVTNIQTRDAEKLLNALAVATNVGLVSPDRPLEDALRARLDLPRRAPTPTTTTMSARSPAVQVTRPDGAVEDAASAREAAPAPTVDDAAKEREAETKAEREERRREAQADRAALAESLREIARAGERASERTERLVRDLALSLAARPAPVRTVTKDVTARDANGHIQQVVERELVEER